jgi:tetratricopeptide (TPR) repeat protein
MKAGAAIQKAVAPGQGGDLAGAMAGYQKVLKREPSNIDALLLLGRAHCQQGELEAGSELFRKIIKLRPHHAPAHFALGLALWNLERFNDALACFDRVLAIEPGHAGAAGNKGALLDVLGRLEEARTQMARAIAMAPDNTANYRHLSEIKRFTPGDADIATMERLLPGFAARPAQDRINLHFALAKAYGDIGAQARSFQHLLQGNALKRRQTDYDERATLKTINRIADVFTPDLIRAKSAHGEMSERPIFIVGMPRSGTTLIEQILASHPRVHGAGEHEDFRNAIIATDKTLWASYPELVPALTPEQLRAIATRYLASMGAPTGDAERFVDKMPSNYLYPGLIHMALPKARIIHVRRDPIDTCLSCFATHFRTSQKFAYDLGELGRFYRTYERLMTHWREVLPEGAMLEVQYEDVVDDLEGQTRRMLDYCRLEWNEACLAFHQTDRPVRTASGAQVREPLYRRSIGRWRAVKDQLGPLLAALEQ